jgi:putative DNA primase/helicase
LKRLAGKDELKGRRMREDFWSFLPTHKLVLCTNHRPVVKGTDDAIWRRLALVPFGVRFWRADHGETGPEELRAVPDLKDKLRAEREGILQWMLAGCLAWQRDGMNLPAKVLAATKEYRTSEDRLAAFLGECCVVGPSYRVQASALFAAYTAWVERNHEGRPPSSRAFGQAMTDKEFERLSSNGIWYIGVALAHATEEEENDRE